MEVRILYLSCLPDAQFNKLILDGVNISQAAQKFNKMIVKGFCSNGCDVEVLRVLDNKISSSKISEEILGKTVEYNFIQSKFTGLRKYFDVKKRIKNFMRDWKKLNPEGVVFVDVLSAYSYAVVKYAKAQNVKVFSIITDFPEKVKRQKFLQTLKFNVLYKQFFATIKYTDGYIFLTKFMKDYFPNKKFIVMEGLVDSSVDIDEQVQPENNCVYTGILSKKYGIETLIDAFSSIEDCKYNLVLYGKGDCVDKIKKLQQEKGNIIYGGYLKNDDVVKKQQQAFLLVNPRPVSGEYTKFSFPSKTTEYMLAGRPVVTTKLVGIPSEYDEYLYYFADDSEEGIKNTFLTLFEKGEEELSKKGIEARKFVWENKNYVVQTKKIIDFIESFS